ncbi:MAG: hypothetical protein ACTHJQ_19625 [Rhizobiaceae bacterium]
MERRNVRFPIMLTKHEDEALQAYRFSRQIGTKAEAARRLIEKGLEAEKMAATGPKFGDRNPAAADHNNTSEECCNAAQR